MNTNNDNQNNHHQEEEEISNWIFLVIQIVSGGMGFMLGTWLAKQMPRPRTPYVPGEPGAPRW